MNILSDYFLGLSSTAWTAISSIATAGALIVALFLPFYEKISRRYRIYKNISYELLKNFDVINKAKQKKESVANKNDLTKEVEICYLLGQINTDYWDNNKQYISEASLKRYNKYCDINNEISELKIFAEELRNEDDSIKYISRIIPALESTYQKNLLFKGKNSDHLRHPWRR